MYVYDRRTRVASLVHPLAQDEAMSHRTASVDMDLAKAFADAWSSHLIGSLAPKFLPPAQLGDALRDQWFGLVAENVRSVQWRSQVWMSPVEWGLQMKTVCPEYNTFHAGKVAAWLSSIPVSVQPAREYSVCLYLKGAPDALVQVEGTARQMAGVGEADMQDDGTLRLWWA